MSKEMVELLIRVPKKLMDILEAENYFGWAKEDFWETALKRSISCEVNELDSDRMVRFYEKYGKGIDVISFDLVKTVKRIA